MFKRKSKLISCDQPILSPIQDRDVQEGADILMVKPGLAYLDVVKMVKTKVNTILKQTYKFTHLFCKLDAMCYKLFDINVIFVTAHQQKRYKYDLELSNILPIKVFHCGYLNHYKVDCIQTFQTMCSCTKFCIFELGFDWLTCNFLYKMLHTIFFLFFVVMFLLVLW